MKTFLTVIAICLLLSCGKPETRNSSLHSKVFLFEGGEVVGTWETYQILQVRGNSIEFLNHENRVIIVTGSFAVAQCKEEEPEINHVTQQL